MNKILKVAVVLYCLISYGYAQELVAIAVNSPEALALRTQVENIKEELNALRSERSLLKNDTQEKNKAKKEELENEIDSLSDRWLEVLKLHAVEILKPKEHQEVVQKMKEAEASEPKESANKIKMEYRKKLLDRATQKWRNKEIDRPTFREEMKAIDKIVNALETVEFVTAVLTSGGHKHE